MEPTTDFELWIKGVELEGHEEVYSLYRSVQNCSGERGPFSVQPARGAESWLVKAPHCDQQLLLASSKARESFLSHLERTYCGDLDMEGWHSYMQSVTKSD